MDLVSYICDGSQTTECHLTESLFDETEFDTSNLPSLAGLQDDMLTSGNTDELLHDNFNFDTLLCVQPDEQLPNIELPTSAVAASVGRQSLNDLLNAPTQLHNSPVMCSKKSAADEASGKSVDETPKFPPLPSSPQDVKPNLSEISSSAATVPMATVAPFHAVLSSGTKSENTNGFNLTSTSQSLPASSNLQALLLRTNGEQSQSTNVSPEVFLNVQQSSTTTNAQVSLAPASTVARPAVQQIDLVAALQQNPQLCEQLQQRFAQGQTAQVGTTTISINNLSPAPSPPSSGVLQQPIQVVSPPLQNASPPIQAVSPPVQPNVVGGNTIITSVPMIVDGRKFPIQRLTSGSHKSEPNQPNKRSSHNITEQRYRSSINNKITELRRILVGDDSKLSKSSVLQKAIDYITYLSSTNRRLRTENNVLRKHLAASGKLTVKDLVKNDLPIIDSPEFDSPVAYPHSLPTPPHSDPDSPPPDRFNELERPQRMDEGVSTNAAMNQESESVPASGLLDRNRAALCLFMFMFLFFNPANSLLRAFAPDTESFSNQNHVTIGRSILGFEMGPMTPATKWIDWLLPTLFIWVINGIISLAVLWKLLVSMEPVTENDSKPYVKRWKYKIMAEEAIEQGNFDAAQDYLEKSLIAGGRPLPRSKFDQCCAIVWNFIRLLLGFVKLGPWLTRQKCKPSARNSARDAAQVYHRLDQLQLTGKINASSMMGFVFSLNAINLCEVAGWKTTPPEIATKIYVTAAFRFKQFAPPVVRLISRYFLREARSVVKTHSECMEHLQWICHPKGHQFIVHHNWTYEEEPRDLNDLSIDFSQLCDPTDPLSYAAFHFRKHLLHDALYLLVNPVPIDEDEAFIPVSLRRKKLNPYHQALEQLRLLDNSSEEESLDDSDSLAENRFWWSAATVAAEWVTSDRVRDPEEESELYQCVERPPQNLTMSKNPLPRALMWAFVAKRDFLLLDEDIKNDPSLVEKYAPSFNVVLQRCNQASRLLKESLMCSHNKDSTAMAFHSIICEWLITTRTGLWQATSCYDGVTRVAPVHQLSSFDADLHLLRMIAEEVEGVICKVYLHEATLRLMAGANPNKTQQLIERTLRRRHNSKADKNQHEAGARERAYALSLACRHLPPEMYSAPGQREEMIQDAMSAMKRLGYHKKAEDCQKLLLDDKKTAS